MGRRVSSEEAIVIQVTEVSGLGWYQWNGGKESYFASILTCSRYDFWTDWMWGVTKGKQAKMSTKLLV